MTSSTSLRCHNYWKSTNAQVYTGRRYHDVVAFGLTADEFAARYLEMAALWWWLVLMTTGVMVCSAPLPDWHALLLDYFADQWSDLSATPPKGGVWSVTYQNSVSAVMPIDAKWGEQQRIVAHVNEEKSWIHEGLRTVTNGGERLTSSWDPGAATQATRNLYGYPPLHGGETVAQYDARVSWMKTRVCEFRIDNRGPNGALHAASTNQATQAAQSLKATTTTTANNALQPTHTTISGNNVHHFVDPTGVAWSGNFADEPCVEATLNITCSGNAGDDYRYQDVYAYWTWKGISGTNTANGTVSQWMGEGGMTASPNSGALPFALVQSGSENEHDAASLFQNTYQLFVEYEGKGTSYGAYAPWGMGSGAYGEYVYAEEYSDINRFNAYSTVGLPNNNTTNVIYGRTLQADPECAEAIVEDTTGAGNNVEFSTMTFNGIGVLATGYSSNAQRMDVVWHDYMTWNDSNGQVDAVGPITTDNNYSPNDDNALTWQHY